MVVNFANLNCKEYPTLVLRNLDGTAIQTLGYAFNIEIDLAYNEVSTLSFSLPKYVDGVKTPHYDEVVGMRIIDLVNCGQFILVDPQESDDGVRCVKECKAYSLEYEFAKKNIYLEAGTYNFFDGINTSNPDTIIGRILERMTDWTADIDTDLIGKYRTFDDTNKKIYDFIKNDLQEKYGCIFDFDTYNRVIHVVNAYSPVQQNPVYLSQDQLIKKLDLDEDSDSIVTCLDVYGADGIDIRSVNPTGTNKIYNLDYFMNEGNFSSSMITRWNAWKAAVDDARSGYYQITVLYNMKLMEILAAEAKLSNLNTELQVLINERATVIAAVSANTTPPRTLAQVNADIESKEAAIAQQQAAISALRAEAISLDSTRVSTNEALALDNQNSAWHFTEQEIALLNRYFIEDTMEDSSFVARNAITYDPQELSTRIPSGTSFSVGGVISRDSSYMSIRDGSVSFTVSGSGGASSKTFRADMISGTIYMESHTGGGFDFVFSAYLRDGTLGDASFSSSNITVSGVMSGYTIIAPPPAPGEQTTKMTARFSTSTDDGVLYFTEDATEYERNQIEWELLEHATNVLREHASPTYNFSVESVNFLALDDYIAFHNALTLGERVYINNDGTILTPYVVGVHLAFDDPTSFKIDFSSSYTSFDKSFALAKLLDQSVSMGKTLDYKGGMYSAFVNSGASSSVKNFMNSALDIAKNSVLSSGEQAITFDDTGIRLRKWSNDDHTGYEDDEIWMVNNMLVFTDDGWENAKMAIGKIFDPNLKYTRTSDTSRNTSKTYYYKNAQGVYTKWTTTSGVPWSQNLYESTGTGLAYGIAAPYVVGTLLAGENLVIDAVDGSNQSYFRVDGSGVLINAKDNNNASIFRIDPTGVYIDAEKLLVTHGEGGQNQSLVQEIESMMHDAGIDDVITTYYTNAYPTDANEGDLWYVSGTSNVTHNNVTYYAGKLYRYNSSGTWDLIEDQALVDAAETAQQTANEAKGLVDQKINTYYTDADPSRDGAGNLIWNADQVMHNEGDLWYKTGGAKTTYPEVRTNKTTGEILSKTNNCLDRMTESGKLYRWTRRSTSSYHYYSWRLVEDVSIANAVTAANSKNKIYYQPSLPTSDTLSKGDLWYNTNNNNFITDDVTYYSRRFYMYNESSWVEVRDNELVTLVNNIDNSLSSVIETSNNHTYLKAAQLNGLIDTTAAQMQSAGGNVLFDREGLWLMNDKDQTKATSAVWLNANGIMIGKGTAVGPGNSPATQWRDAWRTAISADGIIADVIAANSYLSGVHIVGGDIGIGITTIDGTEYPSFKVDGNGNLSLGPYLDGGTLKHHFTVSSSGNVNAENGTFKGTINAQSLLIGGSEALSSNKIQAGFLELKGLEIKNGNQTTFKIDLYGNVTLGAGSNITYAVTALYSSDGANWHPTRASGDIYVRYSYDGGSSYGAAISLTAASYITTTKITQTSIESPTITGGSIIGGTVEGGLFYATGRGRPSTTSPDSVYYICAGYQDPNASSNWHSWERTGNYTQPYAIGFMGFDYSDSEGGAVYRVLLKSTGRYGTTQNPQYVPIKLEARGDISLKAGLELNGQARTDATKGIIYIASQTNFSNNIVLSRAQTQNNLTTPGTYGSLSERNNISNPATGQLFFVIS